MILFLGNGRKLFRAAASLLWLISMALFLTASPGPQPCLRQTMLLHSQDAPLPLQLSKPKLTFLRLRDARMRTAEAISHDLLLIRQQQQQPPIHLSARLRQPLLLIIIIFFISVSQRAPQIGTPFLATPSSPWPLIYSGMHAEGAELVLSLIHI